MARDGHPDAPVWEEPRLARPPMVRRERPDLGPDHFDLEYSPEVAAEIARNATVTPNDREPAPREQLWSLEGGRERFCELRHFREAAALSVVEVAAAASLTPAEVEAIEAGEDQPSERERKRLAAAVGADPDRVFPWSRPHHADPEHEPAPRKSDAAGADPQPASPPPSRRGQSAAEVRERAAEAEADRQAEQRRELDSIKRDIAVSDASAKLDQIKRDHAAAKRPLIDIIRGRRR